MKMIRRVLSVFLCCVLLAAFAPAVCAEDMLIEKAYATFTVPAGGESFDFGAVTVPDGANYTAKILDAYFKDSSSGSWIHIKIGDTVQAGVRYSVRVRFYANSGYTLKDGTTEYYVNGEALDLVVAANMVEVSIYPVTATPEPDEQPAKLTLLQRIVQFFKNIRLKIAQFFWTLRLLFGLV